MSAWLVGRARGPSNLSDVATFMLRQCTITRVDSQHAVLDTTGSYVRVVPSISTVRGAPEVSSLRTRAWPAAAYGRAGKASRIHD